MPYNLTNIGNVSNYTAFTQNVNTGLMFGWLGILILFIIGSVSFIAFIYKTKDIGASLSATFFILFGFSLFLRAYSLIPDIALFILLIATAFSVGFTVVKNR